MNQIAILEGYTIDAGDREIEFFRAFGKVSCYAHTRREQLLERLKGVEIALIDGQEISASVMEACPHLKYIGVMATGTDSVDLAAAEARGIAVTNVPYYGSAAVAQHTFALILYLANRVDFHIDRNRRDFWAAGRDYPFWELPQMELYDKVLGLAGFGTISRQVAAIARGFGMRVLVATDHPTQVRVGDYLQFASLETMLSQSDIISLHKPLNEKNMQLINRQTLALMKDSALLVNTARGGLIDEEALAEALGSGKLKAAALDVLTKEPPSPENPLLHLPNCVITPHMAWTSREALDRLWNAVKDNFTAWVSGDRRNRVDTLSQG